MRLRPVPLIALALLAVLIGGASSCASDPNVEGAKLYLRQSDYTRALENLDTALAANPDNVDALVLRSEVLRQQAERTTDPTEKVRILQDMSQTANRAYTLAPTNAEATAARFTSWATSINTGTQLLQNPAADPSLAVGLLRTASETLPDSMQGHFYLGLAHLRAGDAAMAVAPLQAAVQRAPGDSDTHQYLGRALLASDRGTEAVAALETATTRFPDDAALEATLLNAYAVTGNTTEAVSRYERSLRSASAEQEPLLRYNYGSLLLQQGRYDDAISELQRAAELLPDNADAHYNYGAALQNKAAAINTQANETSDIAESNRLVAQRDDFLTRSVVPLVRARDLTPEADRSGVCNALFQVYSQLNRIDEATAVAECAGISMN